MRGELQLAVPLAVLAACGRFGFTAAPGDATRDTTARADACAWTSFGTPHNLSEINSTADDWGAWLSNDKLDLYFGSGRSGTTLIYHATRSATSDLFGPPVVLGNLVSSGNADDPFITDDGLQMFFENSATTLGKDQQLFVAIRSSTSVEFASGQILSNVNDAATSDSAASLTSDALTMVFNSTRAGTSDLYLTTRPSASSAFGAPVALSIDTPGFECCSSLAGDGSSMVLISDQSGTSRISLSLRGGADYLTPTTLDPVLAGATGDEVDPTLTRDGTTIVYSSNRAGGAGGYDIYLAERACL